MLCYQICHGLPSYLPKVPFIGKIIKSEKFCERCLMSVQHILSCQSEEADKITVAPEVVI